MASTSHSISREFLQQIKVPLGYTLSLQEEKFNNVQSAHELFEFVCKTKVVETERSQKLWVVIVCKLLEFVCEGRLEFGDYLDNMIRSALDEDENCFPCGCSEPLWNGIVEPKCPKCGTEWTEEFFEDVWDKAFHFSIDHIQVVKE